MSTYKSSLETTHLKSITDLLDIPNLYLKSLYTYLVPVSGIHRESLHRDTC